MIPSGDTGQPNFKAPKFPGELQLTKLDFTETATQPVFFVGWDNPHGGNLLRMRPATVLFSSSTRWSYDLPIVGYPVSAIGDPRLEELLAERSDSKFLAVAK